jgi:FixJ family two-component response regulator
MKQDTKKIDSRTIAVVDDDDSVRAALQSLLRSSGYKVLAFPSALAFLETDAPVQSDCLVSDVQMPGMSGLELHGQLATMGLHIPTIFITAYPDALPPLRPHSSAFIVYLPKPCEADTLLKHIETALREKC